MPVVDAMSQLSSRGNGGIDPKILKEAAGWLTRLHDGGISEAQQLEWQRWKESSPEHARAWQRAEQLLGKINVIPTQFSHTLERSKPALRRQMLKAFSAVVVVGPLAWFGYRRYEQQSGRAYYTGIGESRKVQLADGTSLILNTDSIVKVDYSEQQRQIRLLQGEMFVNTHAAMQLDRRPLTVATEDGWLRLQDCECNVHRNKTFSEVAVLAGTLELTLADRSSQVQLGKLQNASFTPHQLLKSVNVPAQEQTAWIDGVINADNMRLADFLEEVSRYRPGLLICEPAISGLRISGVFQLADTDKILNALKNTLPVTVVYRTAYWVIVAPRRDDPLRT
jgi:transmembrane sensor